MKNPFDTLDLPVNSLPQDIKKAFREKALQLHPDKVTGGNDPFVELKEAYDELQDPAKRRAWADKKLNSVADDPHARHRAPRRAPKVEETKGRKTPSADVTLMLSFEDSFVAQSKNVTYQTRQRCECIVPQLRIFSRPQSNQLERYGCEKCNFTGIRSHSKQTRVYIPAGVHTGFRLPITEQHGSSVVGVRVAPPQTDLYLPFNAQRSGNDLIYILNKTVNVMDAVSVSQIHIRLPCGQGLCIQSRDILLAKLCPSGRNSIYRSTLRVRDGGFVSVDKRFPRGMLYIMISISTAFSSCFPRSTELVAQIGDAVPGSRRVRAESCFPPMEDQTRAGANDEPAGCTQQ